MRQPSPLSGAFHDGARLHLRLSGGEAAVTQAAAELGGEESPAGLWGEIRHMRLGILAAPRLWRLSVPRLAVIDRLSGEMVHDWAGAQRWLVTEERSAETVREAAAACGGHASLFRGARPDEAVFAPLWLPSLTFTAASKPRSILPASSTAAGCIKGSKACAPRSRAR